MAIQGTLFRKVGGDVYVTNNFAASQGRVPESKTVAATVKFTDSLKSQIQEFCFRNDISLSEFLRDAACFYHDLYSYAGKIARYRDALTSMLDKLP